MDGELGRTAAAQRGFVYRWQALECGYSEKEIAALLRSRTWLILRRGTYAERATVAKLDAAGRHVLMVRAVVGKLEGLVVVTHASSLAVQGVPMWGVDLDQIHVHREASRSSRTDAHVVHHLGELPESEIIDVDGLHVARAERSVLDAGRIERFEAGVVFADGARRKLSFNDDLAQDILERQRDWAGSIKAARVLTFSDGDAETVGESRSRVMLARIGLPKPRLQKPFYRPDGSVFARSDFYMDEYATAGEFDGKMKYARALYEKSGRIEDVDVGRVVWEEKRREDAIRDQGNEMVRWVWSELDGQDQRIRDRFNAAFSRAGRRRRAG